MFRNLQVILKTKDISIKSYAKILGVSEKTVQNKLRGITEFTLSEIETTEAMFPEYNVGHLFKREKKIS